MWWLKSTSTPGKPFNGFKMAGFDKRLKPFVLIGCYPDHPHEFGCWFFRKDNRMRVNLLTPVCSQRNDLSKAEVAG
ncbi:MAG: hypothetical protein CO167_12460 [Candidatus Marinimicrobia bacterium CG_4_9_14_3_um_filter_48_9]|nr:MAG: hypothetical protein CO167_12460 [Candidatus Marinimicrobia bacterium CG_4_9_14_3_um_filter_48_9]